jgi:hypothetical protein
LKNFETKKNAVDLLLYGDASLAKREFETLPGFISSLENIVGGSWNQSMGPTQTMMGNYLKLKAEFASIYKSVLELKTMVEAIEIKAENLKMPSTYGRLPLFDK